MMQSINVFVSSSFYPFERWIPGIVAWDEMPEKHYDIPLDLIIIFKIAYSEVCPRSRVFWTLGHRWYSQLTHYG